MTVFQGADKPVDDKPVEEKPKKPRRASKPKDAPKAEEE